MSRVDQNIAESVVGPHGPPFGSRHSPGRPLSQTESRFGGQPLLSTLTGRPRTQSPDEHRRSTSSAARQWLNQVPEDAEMSVEPGIGGRGAGFTPNVGHMHYGSVGTGYTSASLETSEDGELSDEEEEWLLDEELGREGLYRGTYKNLVLLYTFVPLATLLAFVFLGILPVFALRDTSKSPFPYPPYLPFPLPETLTAATLWSLSYLIRDPIYAFCLFLTSWLPISALRYPAAIPMLTSLLSAILQSASTLLLRQLAVPILLVPFYSTEYHQHGQPHKHHFPTWQDGAFRRIWWIALGWAAAEAVVGIKQGYENVALYKDVLVSVRKSEGRVELSDSMAIPSHRGQSTGSSKDARADALVGDESTTPTQTDIQGQRSTLRRNSDSFPRREHSSSISSTLSGPVYDDLHGSTMSGERQPLLTLNRPSMMEVGSLTRPPTNESERLLVENEVERDLDELMRLKTREELDEVYGIPVIRIPVFISCLHRINSILSSLGVCLILSGAYMRSTLAYYPPRGSPLSLDSSYFSTLFSSFPFLPPGESNITSTPGLIHPFVPTNHSLKIAFPVLLLVHVILSCMHTPWVLPKIGIHTYVYVSLLIWLGVFFGALGFWEVLT